MFTTTKNPSPRRVLAVLRNWHALFVWAYFLAFLPSTATAQSEEFCIYVTPSGKIEQVPSLEKVPARYQNNAKCFSTKQAEPMAKPEEIELEGTVRKEDIGTPVGRVQLRWPRKVEVLFGRTPQRALSDAARTVGRALKRSGIPTRIQNLSLTWEIVFMDEELPETQIPSYLVNNCHPAWMTPPANIYVVAQRVVAGCGNQQALAGKVADSRLAQILIHEMGHAVEHAILGKQFGNDRMRAEGFATWFEQYAAGFSSVVSPRTIKAEHLSMAKASFQASPQSFTFRGSGPDYARASLYFAAIAAKKNVGGVMDVYAAMIEKNLSFLAAIEATLDWNEDRVLKEVQAALKK